MTLPFQASGSLAFPPDLGLAQLPLQLAVSGQYDNESGAVITLTGSGTYTVNLGSVPSAGLKGFLFKVDAAGPTPNVAPSAVNLRFNGGSSLGQLEISPGGGVLYGSPSPSVGITALVIAYTTDVRIRVWALS